MNNQITSNTRNTQKEILVTPIQSDFSVAISNVQRIPEFIEFSIWFATPRQLRKPKTQKEFSVEIGVCEDSLTDWKSHPQFWPLVQQAMATWIKERVPDAIGALYKKVCAKGNAKDVEAFLKLAAVEFNNNKK